jgi:cytochrome c553
MRALAAVLAAMLAGPCLAQGADDVAAGRTKAAQACNTCHGAQGLSTLPNAPHVAGQPFVYLLEQLKAYRSGKRAHEVMHVIAKPLSDDEIRQLAAWYSSLTISVKEP